MDIVAVGRFGFDVFRRHEDEFGDIWPRPSPPFGEDTLNQAARAIRSAMRDET